MTCQKTIVGILHLFNFRLQVTWIALLAEEGFLESLNDSSFQVAMQSWWKLFEGAETVITAQSVLLSQEKDLAEKYECL